jgi:hypothetical protein
MIPNAIYWEVCSVSMSHLSKFEEKKKLYFREKKIFCIVFSNGDVQLECQCKSSMTWNGIAVRIYKFKINTKSFYSSVLLKNYTTVHVFKMLIVILQGIYIVIFHPASVYVIVIHRCFGMAI